MFAKSPSRQSVGPKNLTIFIMLMVLFSFVLMITTFTSNDTSSVSVSGIVDGQHWTTADSPVMVTGDIRVDTTLHIDPGVEVRVAQGAEILINGTIYANGTKALPIVFTADTPDPVPGFWNGIVINGSFKGFIKNATIEYVTNGIYSKDGMGGNSRDLWFENLTIREGTEHGIYLIDSSTFMIQDTTIDGFVEGMEFKYANGNLVQRCLIKNCYSGLRINDSADGTSITDTEVVMNEYGITFWGWSSVQITNCWFANWFKEVDMGMDTGAWFEYNYYSDYDGEDTNGDGYGETGYLIAMGGMIENGMGTRDFSETYDDHPMTPITTDKDTRQFATIDAARQHLGSSPGTINLPPGFYFNGSELESDQDVFGESASDPPVILGNKDIFRIRNSNNELKDLIIHSEGETPDGAIDIAGADSIALTNIKIINAPVGIKVRNSDSISIIDPQFDGEVGIETSLSTAITIQAPGYSDKLERILVSKNTTGLDILDVAVQEGSAPYLFYFENGTDVLIDSFGSTGRSGVVFFKDCSNVRVQNSQAFNCTDGFYLHRTDSVIFTDNELIECSMGIIINECRDLLFERTNFTDCSVAVHSISTVNVSIEDLVVQRGDRGLNFTDSCETFLSNMMFKDTEYASMFTGSDIIQLENVIVNNSTMMFDGSSNIVISDSVFNSSSTGLYFEKTENIDIDNTTLQNCKNGIWVGNCSYFTLVDSNVASNEIGLNIAKSSWKLSPLIRRNSFTTNTEFSTYNLPGNPAYSLIKNYWGSPSPTIADTPGSVSSERFVLDPLYTQPNMTGPRDRLIPVQWSPADGKNLTVVPDAYEWNLTEDVYGANTYEVNIINGPEKAIPLYSQSGVHTTAYYPETGQRFPDGTYNWQVITVDKVGGEHPGEFTTFHLDTGIRKPVLLEPSSFAFISTLTPEFSWYEVFDQYDVAYRLIVDNDTDMSDPILETETTGTSYQLEKNLTNFERFYWKIIVTDAFGNTNSSDVRTFYTDVPEQVSAEKDEKIGDTELETDYAYTKTLTSGDIVIEETENDESAYSKTSVTDTIKVSANENLTIEWLNFTIHFTPEDIVGFDPGSLAVYRYLDFAKIWARCENCGIDLGTYSAWVNVTDLGTYALWGNQYPIIELSVEPTEGLNDTSEIVFSAIGSYDPDDDLDGDGNITEPEINNLFYEWDFGDGNISVGPEVSHTYEAGTYNYSLIVIDSLGLEVRTSGILTVESTFIEIKDIIELDTEVKIEGVQPRQLVREVLDLGVNVVLKDNVSIEFVLYKIDGEVVYNATESPWGYQWDTTTLKNGNHTLEVDVILDDNSTESKRLLVFVDNELASGEDPIEPVIESAVKVAPVFAVGITFVLADKLIQFLLGLGSEMAEEKLKSKAKDSPIEVIKKTVFLTKKELIILGVAGVAIAAAYTYSEMVSNLGTKAFGLFGFDLVHLPGFSASEFIYVLPSAIITGVFVIVGMELMETFASRRQGISSEVKIWPMGLVSLVITSFVFLAPFGYPARSSSVDDENTTVHQKGFIATCLPLVIMAMLLPFALLSYVPVIGNTGTIGITVALMLLGYSVIPIKPLEGKTILKWNPAIWMVLFATALCLFLFWTLFEAFVPLYAIAGLLAILSLVGLFYYDTQRDSSFDKKVIDVDGNIRDLPPPPDDEDEEEFEDEYLEDEDEEEVFDEEEEEVFDEEEEEESVGPVLEDEPNVEGPDMGVDPEKGDIEEEPSEKPDLEEPSEDPRVEDLPDDLGGWEVPEEVDKDKPLTKQPEEELQ